MKIKSFFLGTILSFSMLLSANAEALQGLRGEVAIDDETMLDVVPYQIQEGEILRKSYRQQPPLIPHQMDKYQINLKANQCLRCHSWPYNSDYKTVSAPESHYIDAQSGQRTDKLAPDRWFCTQCHVPQFNAPELIENVFIPSDRVK